MLHLFAEANVLPIVADFNHPSIDWGTGSCRDSTVKDAFLQRLENRALTQQVRRNVWLESGQYSSLPDQVITGYENDVKGFSCHTTLEKTDPALSVFIFRLREDNVPANLRRIFGQSKVEKLKDMVVEYKNVG